jgi:hypothetical protein
MSNPEMVWKNTVREQGEIKWLHHEPVPQFHLPVTKATGCLAMTCSGWQYHSCDLKWNHSGTQFFSLGRGQ